LTDKPARKSMNRRPFVGAAGALFLAISAASAWGQVHERAAGNYVVHANALASTSLPDSQARRQGISVAPNTGVLNVVVLKDAGAPGQTVPAAVQAWVSTLTGAEIPINMRAVAANERVSYIGTFPISARRGAMRFRVAARPDDHPNTIEFSFQDKLASRTR
jgi:hypothetical protein